MTDDDVRWAFRVAKETARRAPASFEDEAESASLIGLAEAARDYDPATGFRFRTFALRRVAGAVLDAMRGESLKGYRRSWAAKNPGESPPTIGSLDATRDEGPFGKATSLADMTPSDTLPVGWEAEWQDEVRGFSRRLPKRIQPAFVAHFAHAAGHTLKGAGRIAGVSESRASQVMDEVREVLSERFGGESESEVFMAGTNRVNGYANGALVIERGGDEPGAADEAPDLEPELEPEQDNVCFICGHPRGVNGRCYRCKPSRPRKSEATAAPTPNKKQAPAGADVQAAREAHAAATRAKSAGRPEPSPASLVIAAIEALSALDPASRRRVVAWVGDREATS